MTAAPDPQMKSSIVQEQITGGFEKLSAKLPQQYELIGKLSEGGMGAVYRAKNRYTGINFAIKILRPERATDVETLQRFAVEAKAASLLKHPNVCQVHDFGIAGDDTPYLVMEWIDGISLQKKVQRDGPMPVTEALLVFQQIASALACAHDNKIIHRDLKPANIMLTRDRMDGHTIAHIVDFGIAKVQDNEDQLATGGLTRTGMVVGTPLYMSPEQARGKDIDCRCDVYAVGCVMYFMLTGSPPFVGDGFMDTMYKHINEPVPPIDPSLKIPEDLQVAVLKALEKQPADRYQNMGQLLSDLRKVSQGISIECAPLASEREQKQKRMSTIWSFVIGFAIMFAISMALQNIPLPSDHQQTPDKKAELHRN